MGWIDINNKRPQYGRPVLIKIKSTTQHITYMLDGADECEDWFDMLVIRH